MKLSAHTDGASKGNPGPAAFGYSIEKDNVVLEEYFEYIGETTNNSAEYRAFIAVLKRMKELGATEVTVYSDSELAVKQINGLYKVKSPKLKPLFLEVMELTHTFKSFQVMHIPREYNTRADNLANKALQKRNAQQKKSVISKN